MPELDRRTFLSAVSLLPMISMVTVETEAEAQDFSRLSLASPTAAALKYVEVSASVTTTCANCQLYTGELETGWGGCTILPGKLVATGGWCKYWVSSTE